MNGAGALDALQRANLDNPSYTNFLARFGVKAVEMDWLPQGTDLSFADRGVRVNAISAGPVSTLAARGISGFSRMLEHVRAVAPLRRATDSAEVGDVALFLCSPMARGITGQIVYCDSGHSILMG